MKRRNFIKAVPLISALASDNYKAGYPISCNTYNWLTFYSREGKEWGRDIDDDIRTYTQSGLTAIEPNITSVEMGQALITVLKKYRISMPSIYVSSTLHIAEEVTPSVHSILAIADLVKSYGTKIIVTNPSPISWSAKQNKSDQGLITQAKALNELGAALRAKGITLAYHTHDMEMHAGAREFHHMLQNTDPRNMSFCMDVHWIYRGTENSSIAVFDVLKLYGHRIVELHIRQSTDGIWTETFSGKGDIDYNRFANELGKMKIKPHLVIEQCVEDKSSRKMNVVDAHKVDLENVRKVFGV